MWEDARTSSHPIAIKNVTDALEILSYLDGLTYSKGISLLRMLEKIVGSEKFRSSLKDYLMIYGFEVGDLGMFYDQLLTNANGTQFMKTWLEEPNYPILNVQLNVENGDTKVIFTQSRFILFNTTNAPILDKDTQWKINIQCVLG